MILSDLNFLFCDCDDDASVYGFLCEISAVFV